MVLRMTKSMTMMNRNGERIKFHQKNRRVLEHIVELSTAVVKVDTKVINVSLTQNQCLQCVPPPLTHVGILRLRRGATPMNGTMTA